LEDSGAAAFADTSGVRIEKRMSNATATAVTTTINGKRRDFGNI
jgi:hypothetical protein